MHQLLLPRADLESLDYGSGTGFYLDRWQELGFPNVHASDVSEVAVQRLRERYPSCESRSSTSRAFAGLASLVKPTGCWSSPRTSCTTAIRKALRVNHSLAEIEFC
jgi:hypothetical protein